MIGHQGIFDDLMSLAARGELGHGYLLFGPAMTGKRTLARQLAEQLEGVRLERAVDSTGSARVLSDFMLVGPAADGSTGAGSIGIDAIREIKSFLWQKPNTSLRRMLVIDDAELLTTEAQNALLKVTEEPPTSSLLILITSDIESILPTITSRLPKIYCGTVAEKEITKWIGSAAIAKKAMGKPGLAWRLAHDSEFREQLELAEKLLRAPVASRRDLVKKIIEPDDFNFRKFLDAVVLQLAWRAETAEIIRKMVPLWHRALQLYDRESNFSLNPRLQLEALLA